MICNADFDFTDQQMFVDVAISIGLYLLNDGDRVSGHIRSPKPVELSYSYLWHMNQLPRPSVLSDLGD